jgi:predicted nucleic acid-binding protein
VSWSDAVEAVFLDTCVLLKPYLCDTLLSVAEVGVYRPLWSDGVIEELRRNLVKAGAGPEAIEHRLDQMTAYFPGAQITGYENLTGSMTNHPKDRHVLAAAVAGRADVLVTENLKDFPECATAPFGLVVTGQDAFLLDLLDLHPATVLAALRRQSSRYRREPRTVDDLLTVLANPGNGCLEFARTCRTTL